MIKYVVSTDYSIVGWVEVTKPFDYAVTERSRSAGQRPTSPGNLCWVSLSLNPTYNSYNWIVYPLLPNCKSQPIKSLIDKALSYC